MEDNIISGFLKNELLNYGLPMDDIQVLRSKEGITVAKVRYGKGTAILKCFESVRFRREIKNYDILQSCGIPTITVLGKSEKSILLEDISESEAYRLGEEGDLNNPKLVKAIAKWYKTLHSNGKDYVQQYGDGMYDEWDCFTLENIKAISQKYDINECEGVITLVAHYEEIRKRLNNAPRTLTYNDFYYTNLAVKKDNSEAMMFDYNMLGKGSYVSDVRNVIYWFSEENKKNFFSVYGEIDSDLLLLDEICGAIISLYSAMSRNIFPNWAKEAIDKLTGIPSLIYRLLK